MSRTDTGDPAFSIEPPPSSGNSRESRELAGWSEVPGEHAAWEDMLRQRKRNRWGNFTWISPAPLLASVNDQIVKGMDDLINSIRPRWVAALRDGDHGLERLTIERSELGDEFSFLILGDPGEQDASQYAVVEPLLTVGRETAFMIIDSDVIYPAGDINDYVDGFYLPYRGYPKPIYAIPGNHDWYDGLNGFMWHFCGAEPLPPIKYRTGGFTWRERIARALWRKPAPPKLAQLIHERDRMASVTPGEWEPVQPGPYFAIHARDLWIVCIDTGITGALDREQGEWLRWVSRRRGPKILITGKPIYVDGAYHPGRIDWGENADSYIADELGEERRFQTVDDIVREPDHEYYAVIGGDVHNYQRYSVLVHDHLERDDGAQPRLRPIHYFVAGGGGAYLSATHRIDRVDLLPHGGRPGCEEPIDVEPVTEDRFWCYPLRGDSLARLTRRSSLGFGLTLLTSLLVVGVAIALVRGPVELDQPVGQLGGAELGGELWKAIAVVPATAVAAALAVLVGFGLSRRAVPRGFQTMTATTLTVGVVALMIWIANELVLEWSTLVWKMALASLMAVALPPLAVVGYYLGRDFVAPSVRVAIAAAVPVGIGLVLIVSGSTEEEASLVVGVALLALWVTVLVVGQLRTADPVKYKWGVRTGRLLPIGFALGGLLFGLIALREEHWIPVGLAIAYSTVLLVTALALLIIGWRGVRALGWLLFCKLDPDQAALWLRRKHGVGHLRPGVADDELKLGTRALASFAYNTKAVRESVSTLAEATSAPFFKSFLRADVDGDVLTIRAYGVSGRAEAENDPPEEDVVRIPLTGAMP